MNCKKLIVLLIFICFSCGKDKDFQALILNPISTALLFPENVSQCLEGVIISATQSEITFRWESSANTDAYEVYIENLLTNNVQNFTTENTKLPILLERGMPYAWYVNSISNFGATPAKSDTWTFYNAGEGVINYVPFPAIAVTPTDGSVLPGATSISLVWQASDLDNDIETFDLYFGNSTDSAIFQENITTSQINNISVELNNTYYWKVATKDESGNISISKNFSFSIGN